MLTFSIVEPLVGVESVQPNLRNRRVSDQKQISHVHGHRHGELVGVSGIGSGEDSADGAERELQ